MYAQDTCSYISTLNTLEEGPSSKPDEEKAAPFVPTVQYSTVHVL